ncbi:MAG: ABC transporter permease [Lachnospiraceae bacterium]|nr:ABC transporter permease [Lachnospiraceae bacterium]
MKPFSALYYIRGNKGRSAIIILMMFLTVCIMLAGNYLSSLWWFYEKAEEYGDKIVVVGAITTDTDYVDYRSFYEDLCNDDKLTVLGRSGRGFSGLSVKTTIGFDTNVGNFVFNSAADMQRAFDHLGIRFDCSGLKDMDMVMSKSLADNAGMKLGDVSKDKRFTLNGLIDDGSYVVFYLYEEEPTDGILYRANILSESMSGQELFDYLKNLRGDRKVQIIEPNAQMVYREMEPAKLIFYAGMIILSVILAVTLNSVVTGQYIRREYEFGIYRALGISKGRIRRKIASELIVMDLIAVIGGIAVIELFTFLMNELLYIPRGQFLPYLSEMGIIGLIISNLTVLLPMIRFKGRRMCRMDVTEF